MTHGLRAQYDQQSGHFKSLVSREHPLMPFFISILQRDMSELSSSIQQLYTVLKEKGDKQCHKCGALFTTFHWLNHHMQSQTRCSTAVFQKILLTFDLKSYFCQICGVGNFDRRSIVQHITDHHTSSQRQSWSILSENLAALSLKNA